MNRRAFVTGLGAVLAAPRSVGAQAVSRVPFVGYLGGSVSSGFHGGFREGLAELGYEEGANIRVEYRWYEGHLAKAKELATGLIRDRVDLIVVTGPAGAAAVKDASTTIPVVFAVVADPIRNGLVKSLARPGTNMTGFSFDPTPSIVGKGLAALKEVMPALTRVAIMWNPNSPGNDRYFEEGRKAAEVLNLKTQAVAVRGPQEIDVGFRSMASERAEALFVVAEALLHANHARISQHAIQQRLPAASYLRQFAESGSLLTYGPSAKDQVRRAAIYVDKILKGAKPADLPVEQPTKFELVINMKTAKALGLTIPPSLLLRADQVIE
jgi:putative tryptophan/tyrosine transport system substrate-binding protein